MTRAPSTSSYVQRLSTEQAQIEARLVELGVDNIQKMLRKTTIEDPSEQMSVDSSREQQQPQPPPVHNQGPRPIGAKLRALQKYVSRMFRCVVDRLINGHRSRHRFRMQTREAISLPMKRQYRSNKRPMRLSSSGSVNTKKRLPRGDEEWASRSRGRNG